MGKYIIGHIGQEKGLEEVRSNRNFITEQPTASCERAPL